MLGNPGKQAPIQDSGIECGNCHMVIYKSDKEFDAKAFQEAKEKHYSTSPDCRRVR
jgi:hypothetical protein